MDKTVNWDDVAQILADGKSYLMEHGRCRKNWTDRESRVCAGGALRWGAGHGLCNSTSAVGTSFSLPHFAPGVSYGDASSNSYGELAFARAVELLTNQLPGGHWHFDEPWWFPIGEWNDDLEGDGLVLDTFDKAIFVAKERAAA